MRIWSRASLTITQAETLHLLSSKRMRYCISIDQNRTTAWTISTAWSTMLFLMVCFVIQITTHTALFSVHSRVNSLGWKNLISHCLLHQYPAQEKKHLEETAEVSDSALRAFDRCIGLEHTVASHCSSPVMSFYFNF